MPTDDEILERVQRRATVLRRRQRVLVAGTATVAIIALLGGAVVAGAVRDGGDPVDVAAEPTDPQDPTVPTTAGAGELACTPTTNDSDLGSATADPGGSPSAPTDGSGSETSSIPTTTSDPLPAHGEPAGASPAESSIPPDDPPAATHPTVEASSTACPLQVRVAATYDPATLTVDLAVAATAEPLYDAHGFVVWDAADPVQVDLGAIERDRGSCDAKASGEVGAEPTGEPLRGDFTAAHTYAEGGPKEVTVEFWARRCGGPVHQVEVTVTVPL